MTILGTVLLASLLGSLHCAGMCGPLVAVALGDSRVRSLGGRAILHMAYHGARLLTYSAVGLVCGLLGAGLNWGSSFFGVQRAAALVVGCVMVAGGVIRILRYVGVRWSPLRVSAVVQRWVVAGQRAALRMRALPRAALIGLLTAFLPCGWLYLFAIAAAGTGSPWWGAAVMAAFWLGTVPVLSLVGISVQTLTGVVGQRLPLVTSLVIIVLGLYTAYGRLTIPAEAFERRAMDSTLDNTSATAEQRIEAALQQEPPCCCHESK